MMRATRRWTLAAVAGVALLAHGCDGGTERPLAQGDPLQPGESLGAIERFPGGTAVAENVRTLLTLQCEEGRLTLRTNLEVITGAMDCSATFPQSVLDRFIGQPVVIRYEEGGRLIIENPAVGTFEVRAQDPRVLEADVTPGP